MPDFRVGYRQTGRNGINGKFAREEIAPSVEAFPGGSGCCQWRRGYCCLAVERWETPRSWTWTTVGEVGEVKKGMVRTPRNRPGADATKYLRAANITESGLDLTHLLEMDFDAEEREVFALRPGDIVLSEASGSPEQVGKRPMERRTSALLLSEYRTPVSPDGAIKRVLACHISALLRERTVAHLVRGVGIGHLGSERFALFPFPLPPRKEQDRIVEEFAVQTERVRTALASLQSAREKMALQRQAITRHELGLTADGPAGSPAEPPPGWTRLRLGEICEAVNGRAFKSSEWTESGLPIVRIQNLRDRARVQLLRRGGRGKALGRRRRSTVRLVRDTRNVVRGVHLAGAAGHSTSTSSS